MTNTTCPGETRTVRAKAINCPAHANTWRPDCLRGTPLICGILNVTPDSFSDGGLFDNPRRALAHGAATGGRGRRPHRHRRRVNPPRLPTTDRPGRTHPGHPRDRGPRWLVSNGCWWVTGAVWGVRGGRQPAGRIEFVFGSRGRGSAGSGAAVAVLGPLRLPGRAFGAPGAPLIGSRRPNRIRWRPRRARPAVPG